MEGRGVRGKKSAKEEEIIYMLLGLVDRGPDTLG